MMKVTQVDIAAALKHMGFDSVDDLHYWAADNNELNRFDALSEAFAARAAKARQEVLDRIVKWLRDDAALTTIEARRILGNLVELTPADTEAWAKLIAMKHGIADNIERGTWQALADALQEQKP